MKKIKSYTGIWNVEKVLYAINDFNLPFPVTFTQITWFVITEFIIILFGDMPPLSMIEGAFLKYFGIPVALTWFMSQKTFDGKKPYSFLKSQINTFHVITERGCDDMKPSDFQKTIQCQFDCKLKRVVKGIVRNYRKELKRRRNKEISYCELPEIVVEKLAVWDEYESDYTAFDVCGIEVRVLDDDLAEAIKYLSEKDREILLMYFFLDMSDTEIGKKLEINRSTSFRSRKHSLEEIKKKLKENMNDE